jgi:hypothetical protein
MVDTVNQSDRWVRFRRMRSSIRERPVLASEKSLSSRHQVQSVSNDNRITPTGENIQFLPDLDIDDWNYAQNMFKANIKVGTDLNTVNSTYRKVARLTI